MGCQPWSCRNHVLTSKDLATKNESLATTVFWLTFLALDKILIKQRCEMSNRSLLRNVVYSEAQAQLLGWKNISIIYSTFLYQSKSQRKLNACKLPMQQTRRPTQFKDCFLAKGFGRLCIVTWGCGKGKASFDVFSLFPPRCLHGWQRFQLQRTRARKRLTRWFDQRIHGPKNNPKAWRVDKKRQHTD